MPDDYHDEDQTQSFIPLAKGAEIGHYKIISKIGAGGMGEVYLAEDTSLNRKVALKFLSPFLCQDEKCRNRFQREAQAAARLSHQNIVTVYEVGEYKKRPFISMEYIDCLDVRQFVEENNLSIQEILRLFIDICNAVGEAHLAGILHRDIKPSNILVNRNGIPKLADFGLARIQGTTELTQSQAVMGTVGYMAPEVFKGVHNDLRSDIFSLGVVVYELLTGDRPFKGDTPPDVQNAILNDTPDDPAIKRTEIVLSLVQAINKCLEKDPQDRFQNAAELVRAIQHSLDETLPSDEIKPQQRRRIFSSAWLMSIPVLMLVLLGLLEVFEHDDQSESIQARAIPATILAVTTFANLAGTEDTDIICHNFSTGLQNKLRYNSQITVVSSGKAKIGPNGKYDFSDDEFSSGEYALVGQINQLGRTYEVIYHIVETADGQIIESGTYTAVSLEELYRIQDQLVGDIANRLGYSTPHRLENPLGYGNLPSTARALMEKGEFLLARNEYETAYSLFSQAKSIIPDAFQIDYYIGNALMGLEQYEKAADHFKISLPHRDDLKIVESVFRNDSVNIEYLDYRNPDLVIYTNKYIGDSLYYRCFSLSPLMEKWRTALPAGSRIFINRVSGRSTLGFQPDTAIGRIIGLSADDGAILWDFSDTLGEYDNYIDRQWKYDSEPITLLQDAIHRRESFISKQSGRVIYQSPATDTAIFTRADRYNILDSVILAHQYNDDSMQVTAFGLPNGERLWSRNFTGWTSITNDNLLLYSVRDSNYVRLMNPKTEENVWSFQSKNDSATSIVAYEYKGDLLVVSGNEIYRVNRNPGLFRSQYKWDLRFDAPHVYFRQNISDTNEVVWITGPRAAKCWKVDLESGIVLREVSYAPLFPQFIEPDSDSLNDFGRLAYSFAGDTILFSTRDSMVIYDSRQGRQIARLENPIDRKYVECNYDIFFAGRYLLITRENALFIYDMIKGERIYKYLSAANWISKVVIQDVNSAVVVSNTSLDVLHFDASISTSAAAAQEVCRQIADCYIELNDLEKADEYLGLIEKDYNPFDPKVITLRIDLALARNQDDFAIELINDRFSIIKDDPDSYRKIKAILADEYSVNWITQLGFMNNSNCFLRVDSSQSIARNVLTIHQPGYGFEIASYSGTDGQKQWDTTISSNSPYIHYQPLASNWICFAKHYDESHLEFMAFNSAGECQWACSLEVDWDRDRHQEVLDIRGSDTLLEIIFGSATLFPPAPYAPHYIAVDPATGEIVNNHIFPEQESMGLSWSINAHDIVSIYYSDVLYSLYPASNMDSIVYYDKSDFEKISIFIIDKMVGDAIIQGDTLIYGIRPNIFCWFNLSTDAMIDSIEVPYCGAAFSPGIALYEDKTIYDYDSLHLMAILLNDYGQAELKWSVLYQGIIDGTILTMNADMGDVLLIYTDKSKVVAFSKEDGAHLWEMELLLDRSESFYPWRRIKWDDENFYILTETGALYSKKRLF